MTDLVVVGAGPAGLATSILASLKGLSAVVLERRHPPLEKACGEGLMPYGASVLDAMGVQLPEGGFRPFVGVRYIDAAGTAGGRFRGRPGLGIERDVLSSSLLARALELGVEVRFGRAVQGWDQTPSGIRARTAEGDVEGRLLVGADGLHSSVRRLAGLAARGRCRPARYGVRRHFAVTPWTDFVEVYTANGMEAYVTPVGPERIGVALLWTLDGKDRGNGAPPVDVATTPVFESLLTRFPALCERLGGRLPADRPLGAGAFPRGTIRRTADRVALVGDAAGYVDPLTGDGVALGFVVARALVETVAARAPLARYEREWRRLNHRHSVGTRLLLAIAARPRLRGRVVRLLAKRPSLFDGLLATFSRPGRAPFRPPGRRRPSRRD